MELFSTQDIATGFGAVIELLFATGIGWIILLGIGGTIAIDVLAPRRSSSRRSRNRSASLSRDLLGLLAAGTFFWVVLLADLQSSASHGWFWTLTLLVLGGWGIVGAVLYRKKKSADLKEHTRMDIDDMVHMSPDEFEELVADIFRARGSRAVVVGGLGDHGVDIEVTGRDGTRALVQCKRYGRDRWVGEPEVRDLFGAFTHDGKAARAYLVTTGFFSNAARGWAEGKPIVLMDGERLAEAMQEIATNRDRGAG